MSNFEFLKANEDEKTVFCNDTVTNKNCVVSSINPAYFNEENMAVKVFSDTEDFYVGVSEFNTRFNNFTLDDL